MSSFVLKLIAMFTMILDHVGDAYLKQTTALNLIGRLSFPIFAFQISEGYIHTKNLKKYFLRLFIFAIISQIPFMLFRTTFTTGFVFNIFFTLLFGLLAIFIYDKISSSNFNITNNKSLNKFIKYTWAVIVVIIIGVFAQICNFDYGFFGIAIIFFFYIFKNNKILMSIFFTIACIAKYVYNILLNGYHYLYILLCLFTISSIIFILLYNGKQGKKIKYFLYAFYPVHLLIIYLIFGILIK